MKITRIIYIDDHTDEVATTLFDQMQAEKHALAAGWESAQKSPIRFITFTAYNALRRAGRTDGKGFDDWVTTVADIDPAVEAETDEDPKSPAGNRAH
jgi:hypothetical protein